MALNLPSLQRSDYMFHQMKQQGQSCKREGVKKESKSFLSTVFLITL